MDFDDYQSLAGQTDQFGSGEARGESISLFGLIGELGSLFTCFKKRLRDRHSYLSFKDDVKNEMGDILWYLANLASKYSLSLNEIAEENLKKISAMWPDTNNTLSKIEFYDEEYPADEQLPRNASVRFTATSESSVPGIKLRIEQDGEIKDLGDLIDDNAHQDDGYRYHDCFHLAYAAILGWSPVIRWMYKNKRRSNAEVDRIEDGARAILIEELISQLVHSYAREHSYFENIQHIDNDLILSIQKLVSGLEVKSRSISDWKIAIFEGYKIFRQLRDNKGGIVEIDLENRRIEFKPE